MTRGFDSPTKWANAGFRLASSFFVFVPVCVNLPQFVPTMVTNWSQDSPILIDYLPRTRSLKKSF